MQHLLVHSATGRFYLRRRRRVKKERLDVLLVNRGMFESRAKAQAAVMAGQVLVNEQKIDNITEIGRDLKIQ